jgi:hypothetical protein
MGADEFDKDFNVMTCPQCGTVNDITMSKVVQRMKVELISTREVLRNTERNLNVMLRRKNGEMMATHKCIKELYNLMTPEQREQAFKHSQQLRDKLKQIKKKFNEIPEV